MWIAATLGESRIPKSFATTAKINVLCETIERPAIPFALRLSASLMLGVVRVFSRKANIMLSDVTAILQMLSRHQANANVSARNRKRTRDALFTTPAHHDPDNISLQGDKGVARFEAITLQNSKRRRRGFGKNVFSPHNITNAGGITTSALPPWPPILDDTEEHVLAAMETLFPSIPIPRLGGHISSGPVDSPNTSLNRSPNRKTFHAREEDITIRLSGSVFGDAVEQHLLSEDQELGGRLFPLSPVQRPVARPLFQEMSPFDDNRMRSSPLMPTGEDPSQKQIDDLRLFEPIDLQPMQIPPLSPSRVGNVVAQNPTDNLIAGNQAISSEKEKDEESSGARKSASPPKKSVLAFGNSRSASDGSNGGVQVLNTTDLFDSPQLVPDAMKDTVGPPVTTIDPATSTKPKRRLMKVVFDETTELSTQELRMFLNNTSDIVLGQDEERVGGSRDGRSRRRGHPTTRGMPAFIRRFSKEVQDLWEEMVAEAIPQELGKTRDRTARQRGTSDEQAQSGAARNDESLAFMTDQEQRAGIGSSRQMVDNLHNAPIDPLAMSAGLENPVPTIDYMADVDSIGKGSSSAEKMRAVVGDVNTLSIPSASLTARSGSTSVPSAMRGADKRSKNTRDRLFDMVCKAGTHLESFEWVSPYRLVC